MYMLKTCYAAFSVRRNRHRSRRVHGRYVRSQCCKVLKYSKYLNTKSAKENYLVKVFKYFLKIQYLNTF